MRAHIVIIPAVLLAASVTIASASSRDDREHRDEHQSERPRDPLYAKECGSCHVAYPPGMLPASSWKKIMAGLDRHFGQNAELDRDTGARLEAWIVAGAAPEHGPAESLRITEQPWFLHEHDELPAGVTARPSIRTMANCAACHPRAESWDFEEDRVKIPRS